MTYATFDKKSFNQIYESMSEDLMERAPQLTDFTEGSVIRSICESLSYEIAVLYEQLELVYTAAFIDTASGTDIDAVAACLGIKRGKSREKDEEDENFKERAKGTLYQAGRTTIDIIEEELSDMTVIKEITVENGNREITYGALEEIRVIEDKDNPGIITILIDGLTMDNANDVMKRIDEVRAAGIITNIKAVKYINIDIFLNIRIDESITGSQRDLIKERVYNAVRDFIGGLGMGEAIAVSHMTRTVLEVEGVKDLSEFEIKIAEGEKIGGSEDTEIRPSAEWERFIPKRIGELKNGV